jgi:DNA-binding FadR family transcriptional regulator
MERVVESSIENVDNVEAFVEGDYELHELIGQAAGNAMLSRFMTSIGQISRASRLRTGHLPNVPSESVRDHQKIVQALKARDPQAAQQAMLNHLDSIERRLREIADAEDADADDSTS